MDAGLAGISPANPLPGPQGQLSSGLDTDLRVLDRARATTDEAAEGGALGCPSTSVGLRSGPIPLGRGKAGVRQERSESRTRTYGPDGHWSPSGFKRVRGPRTESGQEDIVAQGGRDGIPDDLDDEGSAVRHRLEMKVGVELPNHGVQRPQVVTIQQSGPCSVGHGFAVSVQGNDEPVVVEIDIAVDIAVRLERWMEGQ